MTRANKTHIALVLDRSSSMSSCRTTIERALNKYVEEQRAVEGECRVSFITFDDKYDKVYWDRPIADIPNLELVPRGSTALRDAIGKTINDLGATFKKAPESERPDKVLVVILTDGFENSSKEFSQHEIKRMVTHQIDKYDWEFTFMGANQDAVLTGEGLGIQRDKSLTFDYAHVDYAMASASANTASFRGGANYGYNYDQRLRSVAPATTTTTSGPIPSGTVITS